MKAPYAFMLLLTLLVSAAALRAQDAPASMPSVDSIASDWEARFPDAAARRDFRRLREYRAHKQTDLALEESKLSPLQSLRQNVASERALWEQWASEMDRLRAGAEGDSVVIFQSFPLEFDNILENSTPGTVQVGDLDAARARLAQLDSGGQQKLAVADSVSRVLATTLNTIRDDLRQAEAAIDNALAPEYQSQKFRTWVSAFFALLIGMMIFLFFGTIYKKSGDGIGTLLLSDGGLQFVTIFVLIIAIILFGILNILEGRELAAILSGIAGYILGRGSRLKGESSAPGAQPQQPAAPAVEPQKVHVPGLYIPTTDVLPPNSPQPGPQAPVAPAPAPAPVPAAAQAVPTPDAAPRGNAPADKPEPVAVG